MSVSVKTNNSVYLQAHKPLLFIDITTIYHNIFYFQQYYADRWVSTDDYVLDASDCPEKRIIGFV